MKVCLCAAHIQLLSGMLKAATWWTAAQSGSRRSKAWMYSGGLGKIDFDAEQNKSGVEEARWIVFKQE